MLKHIVAIWFTLSAIADCKAQDVNHFTLWSRLSIVKTFSPKWEAEVDAQYRRQDNDNLNILSLPLAQSLRLWIYYRPIPNFTIGFSPFTWFHNYALVTQPSDRTKEWNEYRMYLYGEYRVSIAKKLILFNRLGAEPIIQAQSRGNRNFTRLRWREQLSLQVWPATQVFAGGELFLNTLGSQKMQLYNQVRGFAGIQYHVSTNLMLTGGYMFQHIYTSSNNSYLLSHDLLAAARIHL